MDKAGTILSVISKTRYTVRVPVAAVCRTIVVIKHGCQCIYYVALLHALSRSDHVSTCPHFKPAKRARPPSWAATSTSCVVCPACTSFRPVIGSWTLALIAQYSTIVKLSMSRARLGRRSDRTFTRSGEPAAYAPRQIHTIAPSRLSRRSGLSMAICRTAQYARLTGQTV